MLFLIGFSMFGFLSVAVGASPCAGAAVLPGADGASPGCRAAVPGHNRRMGCDRRTRNTREHEQRPSALGSRVAARLRSRWVPVPRGRAGAGPAPARAARPRPRLKEFFPLCEADTCANAEQLVPASRFIPPDSSDSRSASAFGNAPII